MSETENQILTEQDANLQITLRREKLATLRQHGKAYPNDFRRVSFAADIHKAYEQFDKETLEQKQIQVKIAGRIMMRPLMGKASFASLQDMTGKIQIYLRQEELTESDFESLSQLSESLSKAELKDFINESAIFAARNHAHTINFDFAFQGLQKTCNKKMLGI